MEAKDLMIGDWVRISDDDTDEYFDAQIKGVDFLDNVYAPIPGEEKPCPFSIDCVEPIPLTPEILEKNGFENVSVITVGTAKMRWVSEDTRTEITIWMDDTLPMEIVKNVYYEDEVSYTLPFPGTVHQLQHALRLCEIDKEIVVC